MRSKISRRSGVKVRLKLLVRRRPCATRGPHAAGSIAEGVGGLRRGLLAAGGGCLSDVTICFGSLPPRTGCEPSDDAPHCLFGAAGGAAREGKGAGAVSERKGPKGGGHASGAESGGTAAACTWMRAFPHPPSALCGLLVGLSVDEDLYEDVAARSAIERDAAKAHPGRWRMGGPGKCLLQQNRGSIHVCTVFDRFFFFGFGQLGWQQQ